MYIFYIYTYIPIDTTNKLFVSSPNRKSSLDFGFANLFDAIPCQANDNRISGQTKATMKCHKKFDITSFTKSIEKIIAMG